MAPYHQSDISSSIYVEEISQQFIAQHLPHSQTAERRRYPSADTLYDLAAETAIADKIISSVQFQSARVNCARQMAGQSSVSLCGVLGYDNPDTAVDIMRHYENGRRPVSKKHLDPLSRIFKVSKLWLATGNIIEDGKVNMPAWLTPWYETIIDAKALFRIAAENGADIHFMDAMNIAAILPHDEREKWNITTLIASLRAILRACERARQRADMWTRVAYTKTF